MTLTLEVGTRVLEVTRRLGICQTHMATYSKICAYKRKLQPGHDHLWAIFLYHTLYLLYYLVHLYGLICILVPNFYRPIS